MKMTTDRWISLIALVSAMAGSLYQNLNSASAGFYQLEQQVEISKHRIEAIERQVSPY